MIGAIIGDIVGSRFEFNNHRSKDFELFTEECFVTDDSIMTIAIAKALMESKEDYSDLGEKAIKWMQELGRPYPDCGYGGSFYHWIYSDNPKPYNSYGNGAVASSTNASNATKADKLTQSDTRDINDSPGTYMTRGSGQVLEFKRNTSIGLSVSDTYSQVWVIIPWGDQTGGYPVQVAHNTKGMFKRHGISRHVSVNRQNEKFTVDIFPRTSKEK